MIYTEYGSTGIEVSAIGLGGMRFPDHEDWDRSAAVMKAAYEAGVNYFDTAPGYGKSEDIFGVALKDMLKTRDEKPFYVASKTFGADEDSVRRDLENSLKRMGLDSIDFFHMWCIIHPDAYEKRKGAIKAFEKMRDEGLVKHICVSTHMKGGEIGDMLRDYPFEGVLLGYSAMNFAYREAGLDAAAELNRGVVVMNPLGGGLIPRHPDRFDFLKSRADESVVQGALRFLIDDPRIDVALVGLDSEEHVREVVAAVDAYTPLGEADKQRVRSSLKDAFDELCTGCRYCDHCPRGIPVPQYMESYNHYMLSGKPKAMLNRQRMHWGIKPEDDYLDRCTECGVCEEACTQRLPIVARLKEIKAEVEKARAAGS